MKEYLYHWQWIGRQSRLLALARIYSLIARIRFITSGVKVGSELNVYGWLNLSIHPDSTVIVGNHVRMNSGFARNGVGSYQRLGLQVQRGAKLEIGDRTGISNSLIVCIDQIVIESDVLIGGGCGIYDTDFHVVNSHHRGKSADLTGRANTRPIHIGANSFIGGHCIILKGVTIGSGAVIGAGSVVTRDIPAYEIWAGNPIQHIRVLTDGRKSNTNEQPMQADNGST